MKNLEKHITIKQVCIHFGNGIFLTEMLKRIFYLKQLIEFFADVILERSLFNIILETL